nr:MAG TPA: Darpin 10 [Caudoviricetes sp.]
MNPNNTVLVAKAIQFFKEISDENVIDYWKAFVTER